MANDWLSTACVVVGSGPSPVGRGWGPLIDRRAVVRLHDWHHQPEGDYGVNCTYAVVPGPWGAAAWRQVERPPRVGWWIYAREKQKSPLVPPPPRFGSIPHVFLKAPFAEIERGIGRNRDGADAAVITRGTAALVMAHVIGGYRHIIAVGLDTLLDGAPPEYPAWHPKPTKPGTDRRHDMAREGVVVKRWLKARGVDLRTAQEVWP